ncbi:type III secretion protein [Pseudomonas sp. NPDC007930]|uniref:type III secretion protein n=1 Tax=Pseudomonas sp. NPDC007930 TaxID=3364417 RepID=UPI0036F07685
MPLRLLQRGGRWLLALASAWLLCTAPAQAAPADNPEWFAEPYPYVLVEQDLRKAMEEFGQHLDLTVVFSDKVRGKSRGVVRAKEAGEFLQNLCDANGLSWYFDGNVLYLNNDDEVTTRLFKPQNANLGELRSYLGGLNVYGERLAMRDSPAGGELMVSGPPAYLALVQEHVDQVRRPAAAVARAPSSHGIRVFRGNTVSEEAPR